MTKIIQPTYIAKLPSSGKKVQYRPYTIAEERALLYALQEGDVETIASIIKQTVDVCTSGEVDVSAVPYYDVEFLFLQIRSKSVGETVELIGMCECKNPPTETEFDIDLANTEINPKPVQEFKIQVTGTGYTCKFRHPTLEEFASVYSSKGESAPGAVAACMTSVYSEDEVFDWTPEEKTEFIESMTPAQQKEVARFMSEMPKVSISGKYACRACGKEHTTTLSGFQNFFV
jgi:hypothetical protein